MLEEIKIAIQKNLSAEVGEQLKSELEELKGFREAEEDRLEEIMELSSIIESLKAENTELKEAVCKSESLDDREKNIEERSSELILREELHKLKEMHLEHRLLDASYRVQDMKELTTSAFEGRRLNQHISTYKSVPINMDGYIQHETETSNTHITEDYHHGK